MKRVAGVLTVLGAVFAFAGTAWGSTRLVDDDRARCPSAPYRAIQAAVDAAASGDTVLVCDGVYRERVTIPLHKHDLLLIAKTPRHAVVRSRDPFTVAGAQQVEIARFVIEGDGPTTGTGITVENFSNGVDSEFGSAKAIRDNLIRRVGTGIFLDDADGGDVTRNTIQEYGLGGVTAESPTGMSVGAFARVVSNTIIGTPGSTGVSFLQGPQGSNIVVSGLVSANRIQGNQGNGLGVDVDHAVVDIRSNQIFDNGLGVRYSGTFGVIARNHVNANERQGILATNSGNRFTSNDARSNGALDCQDSTGPGGQGTGGTGNTWTGNSGLDASPAAICTRGSQSGAPGPPRPSPGRLVVDDDRAQCPAANFRTIQAAVDAAAPGNTVLVCDGVYREQVTVPDGKDRLRLIANVPQHAIVRSQLPFAIVGANQVEISRFLIEGTGPGSGVGIGIHHGDQGFGSAAAIRDNLIRRVDTGIDVEDTAGDHIERNTIQEFGSVGVDVFGPPFGLGASARVASNTIVGPPGSTGVRFSLFGSVSSVTGSVTGNEIQGSTGGGTGVQVSNASVDVASNHVFDTGTGISGDFVTLSRNLVSGNERQGLLVFRARNPINSNDARGNGGLDCEDRSGPGSGTGGTADIWTGNRGLEASPRAICRP